MFSTLIRYDFKRQFKMMLPFYIAPLVASGIFIFVYWRITNLSEIEQYFMIPYMLAILVSIFVIPAAFFGVFAVVFAYFYRSLISDEGYLTFTLPVTYNQILASKTITGSIYTLVGMLIMLASFILLFVGIFSVSGMNMDEFFAVSDTSQVNFPSWMATVLLLCSLLSFIVDAIVGVIQIIFSAAIGSSIAKTHKVWGMIAAYLISSTAISVISSVLALPFGFLTSISSLSSPGSVEEMMSQYYLNSSLLMLLSVVISGIIGVVMYLWSLKVFKNKLNLQ